MKPIDFNQEFKNKRWSRYKCANCGYIFEIILERPDCPKCGTNACDIIKEVE